jgi:radical SAM protein with 4Fe4S-binding SPASM domain
LRAQILYFLSFFRALSVYRIFNLLGLKLSFWRSRISGKATYTGKPYFISIEPTTSCNLQCPECPSGLRKFTRPTGLLKEETMHRILDDLGRSLMYVTFYFQGEPLLHKQFGKFISLLHQQKIVTGTSTNAHYLTKEKGKEIIQSGLDRLIVSLDGTDAETYRQYRKGGNFDQVTQNIRAFMELRKELKSHKPMVELQFIVFKHNEHQVKDIQALGKELGVDKVVLKTAQLYEFEEGNPLMPGLVKYSRYQQNAEGKYQIKGGLPNYCERSWNGSVITWDGQVVPCCFDKDADHRFGSLHHNSYDEIMRNPYYIAFRQQILDDRSQIEICKNCTEGLKN